jgi:hypothetical protein
MSVRTKGELLFQGYLRACGLDYLFEPLLPGSSRRPDYAVPYRDSYVLFDVKDFVAKDSDFGRVGFYDAYAPIREKINAGRKKFKHLKGYTCALVLFNKDRPLVDLKPTFIYGAMLGDIGVSFPVNTTTGQGDVSQTTTVFGERGRMLEYRGVTPVRAVNTTISAIIVVERIAARQQRLLAAIEVEEKKLGRKFTFQESFARIKELSRGEMDLRIKPLRVCVCENPFAAFSFPRELFRGPYDERYGPEDGYIRRLVAGEKLVTLENLKESTQPKDSSSVESQ